jgi:hypothetical protein
MRFWFDDFLRCLLFATLFAWTTVEVSAQSTGSDLQARKDRAQLEADLAKAEQVKAEAEAAAFKAKLGSINTANLPQGTIKTDSVVIEGSYIAYKAAGSAAERIAKKIPCGANLVFFGATDLDGMRALDALTAQIPLITNGKAKLTGRLELRRVSAAVLPEPVGDVRKLYVFTEQQPEFLPAAIFAGIDAGMSIVSLFKTDTEFHGVAVTGDDLALQALVAKQWKITCTSNQAVLPAYAYPAMETDPEKNELIKQVRGLSEDLTEVSLMVQNLTDKVQTPLAKAVDALRKAAAEYHDTATSIPVLEGKVKDAKSAEEKKKAQADLDAAKKHQKELTGTIRTQYDTTPNFPPSREAPYTDAELRTFLEAYLSDQLAADIRVQALKLLQTRVSDFLAALTKPDSNGNTPLVGLLRAQALRTKVTKEANIVNVKFVTAGGNNIIKKNAFSSTLRFSGGVVTEYLVVDSSGYIAASGVVACYGGQFGEDEIANGFQKKKSGATCTE